MNNLGIQLGIACVVALLLTPVASAQSAPPQSSPANLYLAPESPRILGEKIPSLPPLSVLGRSALQRNQAANELSHESVLAPTGNYPGSPQRVRPDSRSLHAPVNSPSYPPSRAPIAGPAVLHRQVNSGPNSPSAKPAAPERYLPPQNAAPVTSNPSSILTKRYVAPYGTNPYASPGNQPQVRQPAADVVPNSSGVRQASAVMSGWAYPQDDDPEAGNLPRPNGGADLQLPGPLNATQDPESGEPLNQDPFNEPRPVQQDETDPRPLPGDNSPPTQLPVLPLDPDVQPAQQGTAQVQPGIEKTPFVYPRASYPGTQTYPGPTASQARPQPSVNAKPTNSSQVLYGPSDKSPTVDPTLSLVPNPTPGISYGYPYGNVDPVTQQPVYPQPGYHQPAPQGDYRSVVAPQYPQQIACQEPDGWRPQMVQGTEPLSLNPGDPCFEPLFYLAAFGGFHSPDDLSGSQPTSSEPGNSIRLDNGASFGLALGQYQGCNLRTEFEYAYRHSDADQLELMTLSGNALNLSSYNLSGEVKAHSGMGNVIWQFTNTPGRWVKPYVGAGVGFVFMDADLNRFGRSVLTDRFGGNSSFAYQLFAGINTQLSRQMDVFVEYRHFAADQLDLQTNLTNVNGGAGLIDERFDFKSNNVHFGIRFKF